MARKKKVAKSMIHRDGRAPRELLAALASLRETDADALVDTLGNDTANAYRATVATIKECREYLDEIERFALSRLEREIAYHRQYVNEITALNVLPKMRAVA